MTEITPVPILPSRLAKHAAVLAVAILVVGYVVMALSASRAKSAAFDEVAHVAAGYTYWEKGDFRFQPENGNFTQRWITIPYLISRPKLPAPSLAAWEQADVWGIGAEFLKRGVNNPDKLLLQARAMIALLGAATLALVFFWSRALHGLGGGLVALALTAFCPAMLAQGSLATSDMAFAGILLAATFSVWKILHEISVAWLIASVITVAVLFLTKMSAPLFLPLVAVLVVVRLLNNKPWGSRVGRGFNWETRLSKSFLVVALVALHAVVAWVVIWAAYDFRFVAAPVGIAGGDHFVANFSGDLGLPVRILHRLEEWRLLPKAYLYGYEYVLRASAYRYAFFNGEHGFGGWPTFFPYAFLVKTPLAFFPLIILAGWQIIRSCSVTVKETLYPLTPLLVILAVFGAVGITANLNIGYRHILPLLPPLYIISGAVWPLLIEGRRWLRFVTLGLVALFAVESWMIRPHYLAYFNRIAGGPDNAWRHMVDSSLDWGMDLPALHDWIQQNRHGDEPVHFAYFGMGAPDDYAIPAVSMTTYYGAENRSVASLAPGLYAVSATLLQVYAPAFGPWNKVYEGRYQQTAAALAHLYSASAKDRNQLVLEKGEDFWDNEHRTFNDLRCARICAWLRQRKPLANVAHTILVWRLTQEDLRAAQFGPPVELNDEPVAFPPEAR